MLETLFLRILKNTVKTETLELIKHGKVAYRYLMPGGLDVAGLRERRAPGNNKNAKEDL